jgi:hypothetical protein
MTRKLLPYEHQLIEALGVSEEEYLDFLAVQFDYTTTPEQRLQEPQAAEATVALVLTIVGILFQVASVLLMPRPKANMRNEVRARDQRFSPRLGFNSTQDLAVYGDPVNLIYCNSSHNPKGAVRASTSLVWSSVESYGSSQFMQLLLVLGAARVKRIDWDRVAFGQLPLGDFNAAKVWLYSNENGNVRYQNKVLGDASDPSRNGAPSQEEVCRIIDGGRRLQGYSQAFSPSSLTSFGVYSPIPINVDVMERNEKGTVLWSEGGIRIQGNGWQTGNDSRYSPGERFTLLIQKATKRDEDVARASAVDLRYQLVSSLDLGSVYMLGTAKFKMVSISDNLDLDDNQVQATFECIESGRRPYTDYSQEKAQLYNDDDRRKLETAEIILEAPYEENSRFTPPSSGRWLSARQVGGTRRVEFDTGQEQDFRIDFDNTKYNFTGSDVIRWKNELDRSQSFSVRRGGSIAYTKKLYADFIANKPRLSVEQIRDELEDDLEKARQLRDDIMAGDYDRQLRREARNSRAAKNIRREIERLQQILEDLTNDNYELDPKSNSSGLLTNKTRVRSKLKKIARVENQIEDRRNELDDLLSGDVGERRRALVQFIRNTNGPFTGYDRNRYAGGIRFLKRRLSRLSGNQTSDRLGVNAINSYFRSLIREKEQALNFVRYVTRNWEDLQQAADDHFYTKCLVKADTAAYQTVTACEYVKFAIKCKLFRRVSGRQKRYGEKDAPDGYKLSDNGVKGRMAFFKVLYRNTASSRYDAVPVIFAVRRTADQDNFIQLNFKSGSAKKWDFKFEPIGDIGAEAQASGQKQFCFIENSGQRASVSHNGNQFWWVGKTVNVRTDRLKPALEERGPWYTNEWDLFSIKSDTQVQFSFEGGPEFTITAVTEQQLGSVSGKYEDMSMMAFGVFSGRGVQDLRSITAYVTEGKNSWVVNDATGAYTLSSGSTSYAPDIFADTVLDKNDGIGKYAKPEGVDWQMLALAKRFCKNNGLGCQLFMDGVIAEPESWRQFWAEVAPYSLLEFARVGGKETLIPAVPCASNGRANREVTVSALFNQGNILEGSYREEFIDYGTSTQDLIASVIYRETEREDVFPRNASVDVMLRDVSEGTAIRQTFDLSQFVTQREQAILFGKLLCNQRRWVRRGVEFQTFPTDSPISPGAYIYVDIGLNTWDRITSGVIMDGGVLNAPLTDGVGDGAYSVLVHRAGDTVRSLDGVAVSGGTAPSLAGYAGSMFVLGAKADRKRVFRVTEVAMDEEGQVTVKAMEHPCQDVGGKLLSRIADFGDALFRVT